MRTVAKLLPAAMLLLIGSVSVSPAGGGGGNPGWDSMKSLVGVWEGTYRDPDGTGPASVSYKLVSNGTSLMETMKTGHETDMVTMYAPDGDRIVATHYCAVGNQPRMRASVPAGDVRKLDFQFLDATNLSSPDAMHMRQLVVTFGDPDHFQQEWTSSAGGKEHTGVFQYTRKK
ncbi:MAG: hypothetical protein ACRD3M_07495 [Thermoanaerobaculia bacterium]